MLASPTVTSNGCRSFGGATTGIPVDDVAHLISGSTAMVPRARLDTFTRAWFKAGSYSSSKRVERVGCNLVGLLVRQRG
jgi:hypothetical protein